MKKALMTSDCACGSVLVFKIKKPTFLVKTVAKVFCNKCKSKFMIVAKLTGDQDGEKRVEFDFKELYLSPMHKSIVSQKIKNQTTGEMTDANA